MTKDFVPEVDEQLLNVFEASVQSAVRQAGDLPDVTKRDRVNAVTEHQFDCGTSYGLIVIEGSHASTSGHDLVFPLAIDTQFRHWRKIASDQASMLVAA
jgi:hypothetical protein